MTVGELLLLAKCGSGKTNVTRETYYYMDPFIIGGMNYYTFTPENNTWYVNYYSGEESRKRSFSMTKQGDKDIKEFIMKHFGEIIRSNQINSILQ